MGKRKMSVVMSSDRGVTKPIAAFTSFQGGCTYINRCSDKGPNGRSLWIEEVEIEGSWDNATEKKEQLEQRIMAAWIAIESSSPDTYHKLVDELRDLLYVPTM